MFRTWSGSAGRCHISRRGTPALHSLAMKTTPTPDAIQTLRDGKRELRRQRRALRPLERVWELSPSSANAV
ncbi:MAG: hypothetical protein ACJ74H_00140 [Thermoanaerobaculia bacterium]